MKDNVINGLSILNGQSIILDIKPLINEQSILRHLGCDKNKKISNRLKAQIQDCISRSYDLIEPKIIFTNKNIEDIGDEFIRLEGSYHLQSRKIAAALRSSIYTALFIATIGNKLERLIKTLNLENKISIAYLYEIIGSTAVESIADGFQNSFDAALQKQNQTSTLRFSPGYCDWHIRDQLQIFSIIEADQIGVELTGSIQMQPEKSISGIFVEMKKDVYEFL
ncbi:Vitamin B12 dependent methionine synthase, activation region domain protein [Candidatus Magnetoovum chiemensis]|nr:Vitamin B12 dependent methionine synthase, activation region domain protein [Candidatus Magnetoovum chiemensis]